MNGFNYIQIYSVALKKKPVPGSPLKYHATLEELSCSFWGKVLGYISRPFIKGALIPYTAYHFPVDIEVYSETNSP